MCVHQLISDHEVVWFSEAYTSCSVSVWKWFPSGMVVLLTELQSFSRYVCFRHINSINHSSSPGPFSVVLPAMLTS